MDGGQVQQEKYGRVTAGELVQAVHELLSAAGVHVDMEKQSLLQNVISLQQRLEESQADLLLEQVHSISSPWLPPSFLFSSLVMQ